MSVESLETSESEAVPIAPTESQYRPAKEPIISRARFAIKHPDVLHTPAEYREIIAGLLAERG